MGQRKRKSFVLRLLFQSFVFTPLLLVRFIISRTKFPLAALPFLKIIFFARRKETSFKKR